MADEGPADDAAPGFVTEEYTDSEYVEVEGAMLIAPKGWGWFADHYAAAAIRVHLEKGGSIDILVQNDDETAWQWRRVDRPDRPASLKSIKP